MFQETATTLSNGEGMIKNPYVNGNACVYARDPIVYKRV